MLEEGGFLDDHHVMSVTTNMWLNRLGYGQALGHLGEVRAVPDDVREGFKAITYMKWFHDDCDVCARFWYCLDRPEQIQAVAQYRMGAHWLRIETGRFGRDALPRSQRVCLLCGTGEREDEAHVLLCPLYAHLRCEYGLGGGNIQDIDAMMVSVMSVTDPACHYWRRMAWFLLRSKNLREKLLNP